MGCFCLGFGILGGITFSLILTKYTERMMLAAYIINLGCILSLGFFYIADAHVNKTLILVACSIHGFFLLPIFIVAYELAVEHMAPEGVGDTMSCGLINLDANFIGFVIAMAMTPLFGKETKATIGVAFLIMFINLGLSLVFLILGSMSSKKRKPLV